MCSLSGSRQYLVLSSRLGAVRGDYRWTAGGFLRDSGNSRGRCVCR